MREKPDQPGGYLQSHASVVRGVLCATECGAGPFLVSGREIDTWTKSNAGTVDWNWMTPAKIARFYGTRASHELKEDHMKRKGDGPCDSCAA